MCDIQWQVCLTVSAPSRLLESLRHSSNQIANITMLQMLWSWWKKGRQAKSPLMLSFGS